MTELALQPITVRLAEACDSQDIAQLFESMYADWGVESPASGSGLEKILQDAVAAPGSGFEILLANIDDVNCGFAAFGEVFEPAFMGMGGFLRDVFVLPEYRRKRVGEGLMHRLFLEAGERNWVSLDWHVNRLDFEARTFFEIIAPDSYTVNRLVHRIDGDALRKQALSAQAQKS